MPTRTPLQQQLKRKLDDYGTYLCNIQQVLEYTHAETSLDLAGEQGAVIHDLYVVLAPGTGADSGHQVDQTSCHCKD